VDAAAQHKNVRSYAAGGHAYGANEAIDRPYYATASRDVKFFSICV